MRLKRRAAGSGRKYKFVSEVNEQGFIEGAPRPPHLPRPPSPLTLFGVPCTDADAEPPLACDPGAVSDIRCTVFAK